MAWIDVRKAFDSVDHDWLCTMMTYTSFPEACETESTLEDSFLDEQSISDERDVILALGLSREDSECDSDFYSDSEFD